MTTHPIPLFDMQAQYARLRDRIEPKVGAVLAHGGYVLGPEVEALMTALRDLTGAANAIPVANGTDALQVALMGLGIGPGDAVFVPAFTFVATAGAVVAVGAVPVFCDVHEASFNMDADDLAGRIDALPSDLRPACVIPVDLFGQPADYGAIARVADAHGMTVLADAAQSMGGARDGVPVGRLAPVTATSFYPTKPLGAFGDGGAIFTEDAALAARMRAIGTHGGEEIDGMNSRLDTVQAAILLAKLECFEADRARRAAIAAHYNAALAGHVGLQTYGPGVVDAHAVYAVLSGHRDELQAALAEQGISSRAYYATPLHLMAKMQRFSAGAGSLPVTENLCSRILALPIHADLSDPDMERVSDAVQTFARREATAGT